MSLIHGSFYAIFYGIYSVLIEVYNKFVPKKTFTLSLEDFRVACNATPEEQSYEEINKKEKLFFEVSNVEGTALQLDISCEEKYQTVTIHFVYKGETYTGQYSGSYTSSTTISFGPLNIEVREAFRSWRLTFKGFLKNISNDEEKFISFSGWWKPNSDARFFFKNASLSSFMPYVMKNPVNLLHNIGTVGKIQRSPVIHQDGQYRTEIIVDNETQVLTLRGLRTRVSSNFSSALDQFYVYLEDGNRLNYCTSTVRENVKLTHGFITRGDRVVRRIELIDPESLDTSNHRLMEFKVVGYPNFVIRKDSVISEFQYLNGNNETVTIKRIKVVSGLSKGVALFRSIRESLKPLPAPEIVHFEEVYSTEEERSHRVLSFDDRACQDKTLTGGKGANLAKLSSIENKYSVPPGAVITTTAFDHHLKQNPEILELVSSLSANKKTLPEQIEIGRRVQEALKASTVSSSLLNELKQVGLKFDENKRYAVRSSAVGEDGADLSSAGQLESCLNVPVQDFNHTIIECWCSNFRSEVITYRRNYGQLVNPSMAVVIQEMCVGGKAGVMFTCDPVMNDDSAIVINVIDGIGEDIVSGKVTPDEVKILKKGLQITKPDPCCLTDHQLEDLARVGLFLEKSFSRCQDVEFVVKDSDVFIVQSRDVTGRDAETQFELLTELDSAVLSDHEVITTANVGEVLPFALTPLESTAGMEFDKTMTKFGMEPFRSTMSRHPTCILLTIGGTRFFNIGELFLRNWKTYEQDRLAELCVGGTNLFTSEDFQFAKQRYPPLPAHFNIVNLVTMIYCLLFKSKKQLAKVHADDQINREIAPTKDASEYTFKELLELWADQSGHTNLVLESHTNLSAYSSFTYIIVGMLVRGSDSGGMTPEMLSDFAEIFSNCSNVISADIPFSFKKIAVGVHQDGLSEEFLKLDEEEAIELIKTKGVKSKAELDDFVELHGHRGVGELYISKRSWGDELSTIVPNLKSIIISNDFNIEAKVSKPIDELIDSLMCKPAGFRRTLMKYMVKQTHKGVINREAAKTCLVRGVYYMRKTTRLIAKKLTEEGYLPDEDLFYYLHYQEIEELLRTRSAKIISRAHRRRKVYPILKEWKFEHVSHGIPQPIEQADKRKFETLESLNGTVVCRGKVIGKARVAHSLEEARETQPGEILITHCTDVCWSPYFPIIKGIVTEIGGLLSHGAVVAREYGLPCLIAVEHAVSVFETGETVELNTDTGTISKVKQLD
ncbi:unnamed protein product [Auanema sp. JU1783]|nr:unnamed protein product [Auanema sp. JU1783]